MIAADLVVLLLIVGAVGALVYRRQTRGERALGHVPAQAIHPGDKPFIEQAADNWRLAQRAVRVVRDIVDDDDIWPLLPAETLQQARHLVRDFYDLEDK